ncbi:MAG: riboflavin synthase [Hyphomicrobiaceae bacterium]
MFTGIITDVGEIVSVEGGRFAIRCSYMATSIAAGASIACDGVCLTATEVREEGDGAAFCVDVSNETRSKTTLKGWQPHTRINLERSLRANDELGGHVVTGHVDGTAIISDIYPDGDCQRFVFEAPEHLAIYIAPKGSISINGTSLTVNEVAGQTFGVNLIPHTLAITTWGQSRVGEAVNIEVDLFARYVARLLEYRS